MSAMEGNEGNNVCLSSQPLALTVQWIYADDRVRVPGYLSTLFKVNYNFVVRMHRQFN